MLHTEEVTGSNPVSPTPHKMLLTRWKTSQERFSFWRRAMRVR
jgi:hypothetical protein